MVRFIENDAIGAECQEGQSWSLLRNRLRRWFFHRDTTVGRNDDIYCACTTHTTTPALGRCAAPDDTTITAATAAAVSRQNNTSFSSYAMIHSNHQIRFHTGINNRALDLSNPLRDQRHWHNNQGASKRCQVCKNETHHDDCLPESHFVCNNTANHRRPSSSSLAPAAPTATALTAQTKRNTFALVTFRFKTGFFYIFIKPVNTYLRRRRRRDLLLLHNNNSSNSVLVFCIH